MKSKKIGLKRGLAVILASLFVLSLFATSVAQTWSGKINAFLGTSSYKTEKSGESTSDGIYFDSLKFPRYADFARLDVENLRKGSRIDMGEKRLGLGKDLFLEVKYLLGK